MDKMIQKVMKGGEKVAPVKSIKIKFQKPKKKMKAPQTHTLKYKGKKNKTDKFGAHILANKKKKAPFSQGKARSILKEGNPTLHGRPVTKGQRGLLGLIAGGGKPTRMAKRKSLLSKMKKFKRGSGKAYKLFQKSLGNR